MSLISIPQVNLDEQTPLNEIWGNVKRYTISLKWFILLASEGAAVCTPTKMNFTTTIEFNFRVLWHTNGSQA